MVAVFSAIWGLSTETTPRLLYILTNTVAALMDVPNGATLLGVPRMLVDATYRRGVVRHTRNPSVRRFWEAEFEEWPERTRTEAVAAVLNKAELLVSSPILHNVLGQVTPTIRPDQVLVDHAGHPWLLVHRPARAGASAADADPEHQAPELRAGGPLTAAADVYALGTLLVPALRDTCLLYTSDAADE